MVDSISFGTNISNIIHMAQINYTDKEKILLHLLNYRCITNSNATKTYGVSYPTKWIKQLREEGCNIHDRWVYKTTEIGKCKRVKEYFIN